MTSSPTLMSPTTFWRRNDSSPVVGERVTVPPTDFAISIADARAQVRLPASDLSNDTILLGLIRSATTFVQDQTYRQFLRATYEFRYDQFPPGTNVLWVPRPPLVSVTSITYLDSFGAVQTMPPSDYLVATDCLPGRVSLKALGTTVWPTVLRQGRPITITAVCGYATASDVPDDIKQVLLFLVNEWFDHPSGNGEIGAFLQSLIDSLRLGDDFQQYAPAAGESAYLGYG